VNGRGREEDRGLFRWGVASFEPRADAVLLWTRLPPGHTEVRWELGLNPDLREVVAEGQERTGVEGDHTVCVDATRLVPGTTYWYRFRSGGGCSPVGRTRTLPAALPGRIRIGYVCCSRYSVAPLGVYRAMADREVDLVVHLGDYIYEDDKHRGPRRHQPPRRAVTLGDYRERLAQVREDPDCRALHMRHPMTVIWDDHDLADNAWRDGAKQHDDGRDGPWGARVAAAARARQEWLPSRLRDPAEPSRTWRSIVVGDLAELVLLDTRIEGRDRQAGDEGSIPLDDPKRSLLGDDQRAWLRERLADGGRPWAIVHSGVVVNELTLQLPPVPGLNSLLPGGYAVLDGRVLHDDQWDGYPAERARVAGWMRDRASSGAATLVVSGDVHSSWAFDGPTDPDLHGGDAPAVAVEMTVPATSSIPMARSTPRGRGVWSTAPSAACPTSGGPSSPSGATRSSTSPPIGRWRSGGSSTRSTATRRAQPFPVLPSWRSGPPGPRAGRRPRRRPTPSGRASRRHSHHGRPISGGCGGGVGASERSRRR
jgi:alkaline phosphatase D